MAPEVLHRVCYGPGAVGNDPTKTFLASQLLVQPAILHDYCRHRVRGCDYPGIVPETGHTVRGTFVTGLTDGDIFRLDAFEGNEYERIKVKVELVEVSGRVVEASTYMYTAGEECLEKKEWSYEEFRRDKIHRWADDSNEYQRMWISNGTLMTDAHPKQRLMTQSKAIQLEADISRQTYMRAPTQSSPRTRRFLMPQFRHWSPNTSVCCRFWNRSLDSA